MAFMSSIISLTLIFISFHVFGVATERQLPQSPITFLPPSPLYHQFDIPLPEEPLGKKRAPRIRPRPSPPPPHNPPPPPLPTFDHFKLALQWPPVYCQTPGKKCTARAPLYLTIHGLWPNNKYTELKDCDKQGKFPQDWNNEIFRTRSDLNIYWPSIETQSKPDNMLFWHKEWFSHGTCSYPLLTHVEYFAVTLKLYNDIDGKNLLQKTGLLPEKISTRDKIIEAVKQQTKFEPQLRCVKIKKQDYLLEIRLCYTASNPPQLQDCKRTFGNCDENVSF